MGCKIFVGSSTAAADSANALANDLRGRGHEVVAWTEAFELGESVENSFAAQLRANDYFVILFTPDIKGRRGPGPQQYFPAPNVLFELGAAYGSKGLQRAVLVCDKDVDPPSDFDGILHVPFKHEPGRAHEVMTPVGDRINKHIIQQERKQPRPAATKPPIRWLALIKCAPAKQNELVARINDFLDEAATRRVKLERCGVVWGLPDNFLLSSCPEVQDYVDFIRHFRSKLDKVVSQVDSRLVFPLNYWSNDSENQQYQHQELVLLSCRPAHVEEVFAHLKKLGEQRSTAVDYDLQIAATGIAMGDADVFLITRSKDGQSHRKFIERGLQPKIEPWLAENTTSMPITSAWQVR